MVYDIDINLDNGIWVMPDRSGIGKSFLGEILNQSHAAGEFINIRFIKYDPNNSLDSFRLILEDVVNKVDIIIIDRFTMVSNDVNIRKILEKYKDNKVFIIDCKDRFNYYRMHYESCKLIIDKDSVVICK